MGLFRSGKDKKLQIRLTVSAPTAARLERLRELTEADELSEVIRNALRLYDALIVEAEAGHEFLIKDPKTGILTSYKIFA